MDRLAGQQRLRFLIAATLVWLWVPEAGAQDGDADSPHAESSQPTRVDTAEANPDLAHHASEDDVPDGDLARCSTVLPHVKELVKQGAWFDTHVIVQGATAFCGRIDLDLSVWNAVALFRLDEVARAKAVLAESQLATHPRALGVSAWIDLIEGNRDSYRETYQLLSPTARRRFDVLEVLGDDDEVATRSKKLQATLRSQVVAAHQRYSDAHSKHPWLAGLLSTVLPGAGQVYDGSWQGGAVAFVLNGVLIGSTTELVIEKHYLSAATVGLAASIFYVGNILNAVDLARKHNQRAAEPARIELEALLVPEAMLVD